MIVDKLPDSTVNNYLTKILGFVDNKTLADETIHTSLDQQNLFDMIKIINSTLNENSLLLNRHIHTSVDQQKLFDAVKIINASFNENIIVLNRHINDFNFHTQQVTNSTLIKNCDNILIYKNDIINHINTIIESLQNKTFIANTKKCVKIKNNDDDGDPNYIKQNETDSD